MKKTALIIAVILVIAAFAGCGVSQGTQVQATQAPDTQSEDAQSGDTQSGDTQSEDTQSEDTQSEDAQSGDTQSGDTQAKDEDTKSDSMHYAFEFKDVDGKLHKLSDYEGKPVYLEAWGSWCSVCMSGLEDMNDFAGEEHDYYVLSVVFPNDSGEKSEEDFIEWYKELGYDNLIVLLDNEHQIIKDFGIGGFPSNIFFDAQGNFVGGQIGQMLPDSIDQTMQNLVEQ